ncbi:hypothetical protein LCGC14_1781130 [marine sediment metagenome]|uniref:Uracil-DNA glycosylase-like domain-containing protein n=1 Tax=marine sediment metagenome TaxID=412755 RepID=A0A0F9JV08_9ZZZZ
MNLFGPVTLEETLLPPKLACQKCRLCYTNLHNPKIPVYGEGRKDIMVIGEAPGEEEDLNGRPWQGRAGRSLQREFKRAGIDLFRDCVSYNSINCRPTSSRGYNREPTNHEILMCRNHVLRAIYKYKPRIIFLLGTIAVRSVIGARWTKNLGGISKWRGWTIPDRELGAWLCPTFHPSYLIRMDSKAADTVFRADIRRALKLGTVPKFQKEEDQVTIVEETQDLIDLLIGQRIQRVAWDVETTGLKPYDIANHKIVAVAFCGSEDRAYVTPYPDMRKLKRVLADRRIRKIAQNMKFEATWTHMFGYDVRGQEWDTMLASHVHDNRSGVTGLKFQAYVRFGLVGYDDEIEPYLKGKNPKDSNSVNRIEEAMRTKRKQVLTYCGIDALVTYRLAMQQMEELGYAL